MLCDQLCFLCRMELSLSLFALIKLIRTLGIRFDVGQLAEI